MNALMKNAPGLMGPPDDGYSDVRWQYAVDSVAASMVKEDEVGELVLVLADHATAAAIRKALFGSELSHGDREALTVLHACCDMTSKSVAAEYERKEEL